MRNEPLSTIQKLIKERYPDAKAVFWAGSVAANQGTDSSDLDLVIVFELLPNAYRESFMYDGWPIDAFIHDLDTLQYFCNKLEANDGRPALINMILNGREILEPNWFLEKAKQIAKNAGDSGPNEWSQSQIDKERFLITDILDDIKSPKNKEEQITSAVHLFEPLLQFYFRASTKWTASGKSLIRLFKQENPELAEEWTTAFENLIHTGDSKAVETVVTKILERHGGCLWDGFRSDAPAEWNHLVKVSDLKPWGPASYKPLEHMTAKPYHYDRGAERYDEFNENNSRTINALLEKILNEHQVATVLDLTCGTGSQVFWLKEKGFEVVGSDISRSMLKIAKQKAKLKQPQIKFLQGDCRTVRAGQFDAAITIFNSIGHLTREDFKLTIQNINRNLNPGGLYIFDIFNLDYLKSGNNITKITIDWIAGSNDHKFRQIQFSTISDDGILASYTTYAHQKGHSSPRKISTGSGNTLQVYGSDELQGLLKENGFVVLAQTDINGEAFSKEASERILTVAKKV